MSHRIPIQEDVSDLSINELKGRYENIQAIEVNGDIVTVTLGYVVINDDWLTAYDLYLLQTKPEAFFGIFP